MEVVRRKGVTTMKNQVISFATGKQFPKPEATKKGSISFATGKQF